MSVTAKRKRRAELRAKYNELPAPFPERGYDIDGYVEYNSTLAGLATRLMGGENVDPADLPSLSEESERVIAEILAGEGSDVDDLRRNEDALRELKALMLKTMSAPD